MKLQFCALSNSIKGNIAPRSHETIQKIADFLSSFYCTSDVFQKVTEYRSIYYSDFGSSKSIYLILWNLNVNVR